MPQGILKSHKKARVIRAFFFLTFLLSACASVESRQEVFTDITESGQLSAQQIQTSFFTLQAAGRNLQQNDGHLTVVIEGDGYAWARRNKLSDNPTPKDPIGLKIANTLPSPVLYLARPCQYVPDPQCGPEIWSYDRFGDKVIGSYMQTLDQIAQHYHVTKFNLIGFSGGSYVALVLSSMRPDIEKVTTVAGVLDPAAWTAFHEISSLKINNTTHDLLTASSQTQFTHVCSHDDDIAPCELTERFLSQAQSLGLRNHQIREFNDADHNDLWKYYFHSSATP